jgi:hypothetical protein
LAKSTEEKVDLNHGHNVIGLDYLVDETLSDVEA